MKLGEKVAFSLPTAGKRTPFFHPTFSQPGKSHVEVPCIACLRDIWGQRCPRAAAVRYSPITKLCPHLAQKPGCQFRRTNFDLKTSTKISMRSKFESVTCLNNSFSQISSLQFWLENQYEKRHELKLVFMPIFFPSELTPRLSSCHFSCWFSSQNYNEEIWGNELFRHVTESNLDLMLIFVLVFKPKFFLRNWHPDLSEFTRRHMS